MQNSMYSRSINWYIGIILIYFILFNINISAKDVCNETDQEQVITNGENEQYIPPHKCVTISDDEKYEISSTSNVVSTNTAEVIETEELKESEAIEVEKVAENEEVVANNETADETEEIVVEEKVVEEKNYLYLVVYPVVIVLIILIIKGGHREKN